jgi:DNA-binding response OmpR family regulator
VKAVFLIRREAERLLQEKRWEWHNGVLREIAKRVVDLIELPQLESVQLFHLTQLILAAGLTARAMSRQIKEFPELRRARLEIDEKNLAVLINGERVTLTRQSFKLLKCLFQNLGKPCGPDLLVVSGLGDHSYHPEDPSQKERLLTAIRRLRERIEKNPGKPILLRTEAGGYCLYPDTEQ